ncbi:MAG: hypothetical protein PHQ81_04480 [Methanofollis sp.]|nr:hypothetical protein [Methanofollis sp.]
MKKLSVMNDTALAGLLLLGAAAAALGLAALTGRNDLTTAVLILAGFGTFVSGVFFISLGRGKTLDSKVASLFMVQGTVEIATLLADLGLQRDAFFYPPDTSGRSRALVPAGSSVPTILPENTYSYVTTEEGDGAVFAPLATPLLTHLKDSCAFVVPQERDRLCEAVVEVCRDVLEVSEHAEASFDGYNLVVDLKGFALADGCREVRGISPKCCTMVGCPFCSLIACIAAEGMGVPCQILAAVPSKNGNELHLIIGPRPQA